MTSTVTHLPVPAPRVDTDQDNTDLIRDTILQLSTDIESYDQRQWELILAGLLPNRPHPPYRGSLFAWFRLLDEAYRAAVVAEDAFQMYATGGLDRDERHAAVDALLADVGL